MIVPTCHTPPERLRLYLPKDWTWDLWAQPIPPAPMEHVWSPLLCTTEAGRAVEAWDREERYVQMEAPDEAQEGRKRGKGGGRRGRTEIGARQLSLWPEDA